MNFRRIAGYIPLVIAILLTGLTSCEKFEGDQEIPAYLSIDSIYLTTDYATQGSASQNITDAWVYMDDNLVGAFQMPAKFPVLYRGEHKIKILPGIKKNGIATTRTNYVFYAPIEKTLMLTEDSLTKMRVLRTTYESSTEFYMIENFDGLSLSLDTVPQSEVNIERTPDGSGLEFEGQHSGMVSMDTARTYFECVSSKDWNIPYAPVYLEMNYNTNNMFTVGVYTYNITSLSQRSVLNLNPTNGKWKKIYVDLTNALNAITGMVKFKLFITATQQDDVAHARIYLDNIKVVSRPSTVKK